ncbi:MAG: CobW family GTP-binding protein [Aquificaceae bacterium]
MHRLNLVVSGFLGSGKTTFLLNSLIKRYKDRRIGILVNDFGEISYDKVRLYRDSFKVLGVEGRCVCCSGMGELLEALSKVRDVEVLLVETSGLSDPYTLREALETMGFVPYTIVCVLSAEEYKNLPDEPLFRAQLENSDCVVISKCDLIAYKDFEEIESLLEGKPYFPCYEGRVEEEFFIFLSTEGPRAFRGFHRIDKHTNRFSQITIPLRGFYSMQSMESFLRGLPKGILRVKGFVRTLESPFPVGINWTRNCMSWEPIEKPVGSFLTFIGYSGFFLPPLPTPEEGLDWSKMIPIGEYDRREGIAYLYGRMTDEISAVEKLLDMDLRDSLLITTKDSLNCPFNLTKKMEINPTFEEVYSLVRALKEDPTKRLTLWDLPDAYASYVLRELPQREFIHVGRHYLLPRATLSLRVDTQEKIRALRKLYKMVIDYTST